MHRLLVVDDEPIVLSGICKHLQNAFPELELLRAGNAVQALEWLERVRVDIVLSDIQMPGMTGLELQKVIGDRWPRCKVVFITAYNEFDYIQSAVRLGAEDFILKTEGHKEIVRVVGKMLKSIAEEWTNERLLELSRQKLHMVRPTLINNVLTPCLRGKVPPDLNLEREFKELELPLAADRRVLLLMMRIDRWRPELRLNEHSLMVFALQNIAEEYLSPKVNLLAVEFDTPFPLWLIQPRFLQGEESEADWSETISFVEGTAELIQSSCRQLLKLPASVLLADHPIPWAQLGERYYFMKRLFSSGLGYGEELLLRERDIAPEQSGADAAFLHRHYDLQQQLDRLRLLETYLDTGKMEQLRELVADMLDQLAAAVAYHDPLGDQAFYSIALVFSNFLNRTRMSRLIIADIDPARLMMKREHTGWFYYKRYLLRLIEIMMKCSRNEQQHKSRDVICRVQQYIQDHLHEPLTLVKLAEVAYLNPSYLSRLYKQVTGEGLSDYISSLKINRAKLLLQDPSIRIQDVAAMLGHESPSYFAHFFKKATSLTPQEYRDTL